ncbi:MAG: quinone oxidoreductase [Terracidiphilus sp.]|jgi:NADPH2:quinone reductase
MKAIQFHTTGGPEVLQLTELPIPEPGPGQVLMRIEATGVNFIEIYFRKGVYKAALPLIPGSEAAGTVEELGPGVTGFAAGDAVVSTAVIGSYAEYALVPAIQLVKIPQGLSMEQAAAALLQGMTAHYLAYSTYPLKAGDTALVHAGAGGVGLLLTQMASALGARVITTVSTKAKAELSREAGASDAILYTEKDFEAEVKRLTKAKGVDVVYDSVGKTTFDGSLNCLHPRGLLALFGASSGPVPPFDPTLLNSKGSLFLTRPTLWHYIATRAELEWRASDVLNWAAKGKLKLRTEHTYPLAQAAQAQIDLEERKTTGKILLVP